MSPTQPDAPERSYRSPLREAQAVQTQELILRTLAEMFASGRGDQFSVRLLAAEAEVSERTVYRYFPDREALLEGLNEYLTDVMSTGRREYDLADLDELAAHVPEVFADFDAHPEVTKAAMLINPDPSRSLPSQRRRTELMIDLARHTFPDLAPGDQVRLGQLVRTLVSTVNWMRMRDEFGMDGRESGALLGWAVRCITEEVRRGGHLPTPGAD